MTIKYFSMFTGVMGFELGIHKVHPDWECVGFSEIDKFSSELLKQKKPEVKNYGDCTKIREGELPDFDLLCGGFPCQSFSIAGKRRGFEDTRGTMFFEICRILKRKQPRLVLLENVKGLLNHDGGNTFTKILQALDELGYDVQWQVLNSKHFGVPQNRERVFIVGHLRGTSRPGVFPIRETMRESNESCERKTTGCINAGEGRIQNSNTFIIHSLFPIRENTKRFSCSKQKENKFRMFSEHRTELGKKSRREFRLKEGRDSTLRGKDYKEYRPNNHSLANCITTGKDDVEKRLLTPRLIVKKIIGKVKIRKYIVDVENLKQILREHRKPIKEISEELKVSRTKVEHWFRTDDCFSIPDEEVWFKLKELLGIETDEFDKPITEFEISDNEFDQSNRVYMKEGLAPTLTGGHQHSAIDDGYSIRRLTPTECERLQGFPDGWTEGFSDTQRYKMMGNAVTVNVIEAIAKRIR